MKIMNRILLFLATYNERENIKILLDKILILNLELDIFVLDDNSPDQTKEILKDYSKKYKSIKFKIRNQKSGLDTAHMEAFNYSIQMGYEFLITMDADLSHDPLDIIRFLNEIKKNDFVIGSRYMKNGQNNMKGFRYYLSFFGNKLIKFILGINSIDEFTTSYRCIRVEKLKYLDLNKISATGYSFFMFTVYFFITNNLSVSQIPITFSDRHKGKSKIPKIEILRTLYNLFLIKFKKND